MADEAGGGGSKARAGSVAKAFMPHPSIGAVTFWQGIVEIVLRVVAIVLGFCTVISASVTQNGVAFPASGALESLRGRSQAAAGWLLFVGIVVMLVEGALIAIRFLNFGFVTLYAIIFFIVDICISVGLGVALFVGAIPMAVYAANWSVYEAIFPNVRSATGATAAFSFFTVIGLAVLAVWMVLFIVLKWGSSSSKHRGGDAAADS